MAGALVEVYAWAGDAGRYSIVGPAGHPDADDVARLGGELERGERMYVCLPLGFSLVTPRATGPAPTYRTLLSSLATTDPVAFKRALFDKDGPTPVIVFDDDENPRAFLALIGQWRSDGLFTL